MRVAIIDYGAGNIFSVRTAFERLGAEVVATADPETLAAADRVVFPGVGHAAAAMERLNAARLDLSIPQLKMPVLGICLGMQLMCRSTEEGGVKGLGIFPIDVFGIKDAPRLPHMGWNTAEDLRTPLFDGVTQGERFYFVHSYAVPVCEESIAACSYGSRFSAALNRNNFYGCQFHPEKSAEAGRKVLENFLNLSEFDESVR